MRSVCWLKLEGADRVSATDHVLFGEPEGQRGHPGRQKTLLLCLFFTFCLLESVFYTIQVSLLQEEKAIQFFKVQNDKQRG